MPNETTPIDGQPWPLSAYLRDSPLWVPSGVVGPPAASSTAGDLALSFEIVSGTSVTPKLALGRGRSRGGRYERTVSPWTSGMSGTVPQQGSATYGLNSGSNPRRDRIVLRRDAALQAVYPIILIGTPAASPVAPALTQVENGTWDEPLFSWTLPGGNSTAPANITDERRWLSPGGHGRVMRSVDATITGGFAGACRWIQQGRVVTVTAAMWRSAAGYTLTKDTGTVVASGLPSPEQDGLLLGSWVSRMYEAPAFAAQIRAAGELALYAMWADRVVSQDGSGASAYFHGSFSYIAAADLT